MERLRIYSERVTYRHFYFPFFTFPRFSIVFPSDSADLRALLDLSVIDRYAFASEKSALFVRPLAICGSSTVKTFFAVVLKFLEFSPGESSPRMKIESRRVANAT